MRRFLPGKKAGLWAAMILVLCGGIGYWQKDRILSWYFVRQLAEADEASRAAWVNRVVELGEPCLPEMMEQLKEGPKAVCANMGQAIEVLLLAWGPEDPRCLDLLGQLGDLYPQCQAEGKGACLKITVGFLEKLSEAKKLPGALAKSTATLLARCGEEDPLPLQALSLAHVFLKRVPPGQGTDICRDLVRKGLANKDTSTRLAALQVFLLPTLKKDPELLTAVVPLLKDAEPGLRKAALLALAAERELADDDDLLTLLHDPDVEVQLACELALRSRGLEDSHILLARLISDPDPGARLKVLDHLHRAPDLEPGVWLRRLSQDAAPAVRAAAVRAAANQSAVDLRSRLHQMAREDPSPTVRQLAGFYLTRSPSRYAED